MSPLQEELAGKREISAEEILEEEDFHKEENSSARGDL